MQSQEIAAGTNDVQVVGASPGLRYMGFSLVNVGAAATTVKVYNGTSNAGKLIDEIKLAVGENVADLYGDDGVDADAGIFLDRDGTNAVEGVIRYE